MADIAKLAVKVSADTKAAEDGLTRVTKKITETSRAGSGLGSSSMTGALGRMGQSASNAARSFGGLSVSARNGISGFVGLRGAIAPVMALLAGGAIFAAAQSAIIGFNAAMEQSQVAWNVMLKSGDAAQTMLSGLQQFAARTPFEFPEVEDSARKLMAMGFAARDIIPMMTDIGNVASGMGKGAEGMNRIVIALGQMQAKGRVTGEEMLQLTEMGVSTSQIFAIMAQQTGKSVAELQKMQEQGTLTASTLITAFRTYAQQNFGSMMERQSRTFNGVMSTIRDNLRMTAASAFQPLFAKISELALRFGDFTSSEGFKNFGKDVQFVVSQIVTVLSSIPTPVLTAIAAIVGIGVAIGGIAAIVSVAGPVIGAAFAALTGPVGLAAAAIAGLYLAYTNNLLGIKTWVDENGGKILDGLIDGIGSVIDAISPILDTIIGGFVTFFQAGESLWNQYGSNVLEIVKSVFGFLWDNVKSYLTYMAEIFQAGLDFINGDWQGGWIHIQKATYAVWEQMVEKAGQAVNLIIEIFRTWMIKMAEGYEAQARGPGWAEMLNNARAMRAGASMLQSWKGKVDLVTSSVKELNHTVLGFPDWDKAMGAGSTNEELLKVGTNAGRAAAQLRSYADALRQWFTRKEKLPSWADINRGVLPGATTAPPASPIPAGTGGNARDAAAAVKEYVDALVQLNPATQAAAAAVRGWEANIASVNLAIKANQDQLKAAQGELQRMQDRLKELQAELDIAKRKLQEFSQPRLTGMGEMERNIAAVQEQLKRVQLAKSLGVPLSSIISQFPRLTAGAEEYLGTLPTTESGLQKVLDQLTLMQSLSFDEKMRLLGQAAQDTVPEMGFDAAMAGTLKWKAQVDSLTIAIAEQEAAIKRQEQVIRDIQAAGDALNNTLEFYQTQLAQAKANQDAVTQGLTMAYTWLLQDRQAMLDLGGTAATMVPLIDAQMAALLQGFDKFATGEAALVNGGIVTLYESSKQKLDEINALVQSLNTTVVTTHIIRTVYEDVPGRASGGSVYAGQAYVVGEKQPELFVPDTDGRIVPSVSMPNLSGPNRGRGGNTYITVQLNVEGNVQTERDLVQAVEVGLARSARRNGGAGVKL